MTDEESLELYDYLYDIGFDDDNFGGYEGGLNKGHIQGVEYAEKYLRSGGAK